MENEYANFGLPKDSADEQYVPVTVQRGWFRRNLWWIVPGAVIVVVAPIACCGGIFWWVLGLKSSQPYQLALEQVRHNPQLIAQLGEPIAESSWMPIGDFSIKSSNGSSTGKADFIFFVAGPKGTAHVHAVATSRDGKWQIQRLEATPITLGKAISLPVSEKPKPVEQPEQEE